MNIEKANRERGQENSRKTLPAKLAQQKPEVLYRRPPEFDVRDKSRSAEMAERHATPVVPAWQELKEQSIFAFESGLLPRSVDSRQKAVTIALMGRELGLSPMQSLCGIYVVNGMTALRGSLMLRLIYERIPGAEITVVTPPEKADEECTVEMKRPNGKVHTFRYTLEDAKKAGFANKQTWQQHTSTMLRWAAIRTGARVVFADAIAGCYMEDEIPAEQIPVPTAAPDAPLIDAHGNVKPSETSETFFSKSSVTVSQVGMSRPVTEKQINRLYAIAHEKQWTRAEVSAWLEKWFQKKDARELTRFEYDKFCNHLLNSAVKTEPLAESQSKN